MKILGIIWLEEIVDKLAWKHHVQQYEVCEALKNAPLFRLIERGYRQGEHVYSASGQTDAGRYLIVFFVYKTNKKALAVSARDMTHAERKLYEQS